MHRKHSGEAWYRGRLEAQGLACPQPLQSPLDTVRDAACPLTSSATDYDVLLDLIGDARVVLLGEASHGTHEFYRERARITRRLIEEKGFIAVAVEADWPDAYRVNRWVRDATDDRVHSRPWAGSSGFPSGCGETEACWNSRNGSGATMGFRGRRSGWASTDSTSTHCSARSKAVIDFLEKVDPEACQRARYRYACFEDFGEDTEAYGYAAEFGLTQSCEDRRCSSSSSSSARPGRFPHRDGRIHFDQARPAQGGGLGA